MAPFLDHIIILVPYISLLNLPAWIPDNFTITPGGRHADGKTENKLISFQDGSYIEIIAFINDDPKHRAGHWWGDRKFGIIDLAFTDRGDADTHHAEVQRRLESIEGGKVRYMQPVEGGRKRPDGEELKWKVTFPDTAQGFQRGELPFFCHDVTPRSLRVPFTQTSVRHPSSGYGIKQMSIYVPEARVKVLSEAYAAILDVPNTAKGPNLGLFEVPRMNQIVGAPETIKFHVQAPPEDWQMKGMTERGGVMLGSVFIGGLMTVAVGLESILRIDILEENGVGGIYMDLEVPPRVSQPTAE